MSHMVKGLSNAWLDSTILIIYMKTKHLKKVPIIQEIFNISYLSLCCEANISSYLRLLVFKEADVNVASRLRLARSVLLMSAAIKIMVLVIYVKAWIMKDANVHGTSSGMRQRAKLIKNALIKTWIYQLPKLTYYNEIT